MMKPNCRSTFQQHQTVLASLSTERQLEPQRQHVAIELRATGPSLEITAKACTISGNARLARARGIYLA